LQFHEKIPRPGPRPRSRGGVSNLCNDAIHAGRHCFGRNAREEREKIVDDPLPHPCELRVDLPIGLMSKRERNLVGRANPPVAPIPLQSSVPALVVFVFVLRHHFFDVFLKPGAQHV
jgi:hypothetical protein